MPLRWLVEVRKDAPRWPYLVPLSMLLLAAAAGFYNIGKEALDLFLLALIRCHADAVAVVAFAIVCYVQTRRPTALGWLLAFGTLLGCTLLFGLTIKPENYLESAASLVAGGIPSLLLFLFRPLAKTRTQGLTSTLLCAALCGLAAFSAKYYEESNKPMDAPVIILFPGRNVTLDERRKSLSGDFRIVTKMKKLPPAIQDQYEERFSSRLAIADVGKQFNETDDIVDSSLPRRRLMFAGISIDRCFVYYEQGGFVTFFRLDVFSLPNAQPLWNSNIQGEAQTLDELRQKIEPPHVEF
jgi:hypothetical protein